MLEFEAALARLVGAVPTPSPAAAVQVPLSQSLGRYLADSPPNPSDLPGTDNSAMDGWAVRSEDCQQPPFRLRQVGHVAAGAWFDGTLGRGETVRVFTGSPLPYGANAVAMQEDAKPDPLAPDQVEFHEVVRPWESVRLRGEDLRIGAPLLPGGTRIGPAQLALLAAAGLSSVSVHRPLRVAILPNGSELITPGQTLPRGGVFDSNGPTLAALVATTGAEVRAYAPPADQLEVLGAALRLALAEADVVVTAGGASVGEHDLIRPAFASLGGQLDFWQIALKPGKPFFFGTLPGSTPGTAAKFLFGVPGNPVSAFVTTLLLVLPAVRKMLGAGDERTASHPGQLQEPLSNPEARRHFVRVYCDGLGGVRSTGPQGSHRLGPLALANGLVDLPPRTQWPAGTVVNVLRW